MYAYYTHYFSITLLLLIMMACGSFVKNSGDILGKTTKIKYDDTECHRGMEIWFGFFFYMCPIFVITAGFIAKCLAKNNH